LAVRFGYLSRREKLTGGGLLEIWQSRMPYNSDSSMEPVEFVPKFTADGCKELISVAD